MSLIERPPSGSSGKTRNPNFPSLGLDEAIQRIKAVYERERTSPATRAVIARALGYSGISGSSARVIGSLRQLGLLDGRGENMRVSETAIDLLHAPQGSSQYLNALRKAFLTSDAYREIIDRYGSLDISDENLKYFLVKKSFSKEGADQFLTAYRASVDMLKRFELADNLKTTEEVPIEGIGRIVLPLPIVSAKGTFTEPAEQVALSTVNDQEKSRFENAGHMERTVLGENSVVELRFNKAPTEDDVVALQDYLEFRLKGLRRATKQKNESEN